MSKKKQKQGATKETVEDLKQEAEKLSKEVDAAVEKSRAKVRSLTE